MKHKLGCLFSLYLAGALAAPFWANAQSTDPRDTLHQYVSDLQRNPSDTALREKIIKLAQEMNPPPAIPEEARRHYVKASTLLDDAKQPSDSADAAEEFRQALLIAPWWGEVYMKMGLALETAQRYDDAIAALKLFMTTSPQGELQRKTQDEIYKIEARQEKAAKDKELAARKAIEDQRAQEQATEASKAREQEEFLRKIDGARYVYRYHDEEAKERGYFTFDVQGDIITQGHCVTSSPSWKQLGVWRQGLKFRIDGRTFHLVNSPSGNDLIGVITEDGSTITFQGGAETDIYKRER
jgi:tetratricopeptide (TPR) repeat protein